MLNSKKSLSQNQFNSGKNSLFGTYSLHFQEEKPFEELEFKFFIYIKQKVENKSRLEIPEKSLYSDQVTNQDCDIAIQSHLIFLKDIVGFNISQLAVLFKVGRATIYDWLSGSIIPRRNHINRIDLIYSVFENWNKESNIKLRNYYYKKIDDNKSLYDLLSVDDLNSNIEQAKVFAKKVEETLQATQNRMSQLKALLEREGFKPVSKERRREVIERLIRKA